MNENNNYFKLITDGKIERIEHFDDRRPHSVTAAYIRVTRGRRLASGDKHQVSVWRQGANVPDHVPEVGTWYCPKCNQQAESHRPNMGCPLAA